MPPPPRRVPPPARRLGAAPAVSPPPAAPAPTGRPKGDLLIGEDGKPEIRIWPSSNLYSILADTRRALKDSGADDLTIGQATDALLLTRSTGNAETFAKTAERWVRVIRR